MRDWEYIGDQRKINALKFAEKLAYKVAPPGIVVTGAAIEQIAEYLFPEAFNPFYPINAGMALASIARVDG